ncbi:MAG TPA: heat-inducible transcriptional repressor HrcA [Candidatus Polarisedimenticolia bacterium]|nr:heat-inducible transcriptional repressor HrcA [Candidatus Polarisedimenticolia bacterium]
MPETELDRRDREILREIIRNFIETGEPVGSRTIAKVHPEGLSPASIRNIMADLEEAGYLMQPHTSAGRVPTDRGYRYYVDSLLTGIELPRSDREKIAEVIRKPGSLPEALEEISRLISRLTHQVGFVVSPDHTRAILRHLEFVSLGPHRILAILVDRAGVIHNRIARTSEDFSQEDLDRIGRYLVAEYQGKTLPEIREALLAKMKEEKAAFDTLLAQAISLGTQIMEPTDEAGKQVYMKGTSNILNEGNFTDIDEMRKIFETFEARGKMVKILDEVTDSEGLRIVIGSEHPDPSLAHLSLVASPYKMGDRPAGVLGVLGPTRMEYARAIALVDYISKLLSKILTAPPS